MSWDWKPIDTAPKDGRDILICLPGGQSDHYYPVCWDEEDIWDGEKMVTIARWKCRYGDLEVTEESIAGCYLLPMWCELDAPPSSLCSDGDTIKNPQYSGR